MAGSRYFHQGGVGLLLDGGGGVPVCLRKSIATSDFPGDGWGMDPLFPPLDTRTHVYL